MAELLNTEFTLDTADYTATLAARRERRLLVKRRRKQREFLKAYADCPIVKNATKKSGIDGRTHAAWLKRDEWYREKFEELQCLFGPIIEGEAYRRAVQGVLKPVFYKGEKCGSIREYSDTLLALLLKGNLPEKYRDKAVEVTGKVDHEHSGEVQHKHSVADIVSEMHEEPEYVDYLRACQAGGNAGDIRGNGFVRSMEVRPASATDRPGSNGHDSRRNGTHLNN